MDMEKIMALFATLLQLIENLVPDAMPGKTAILEVARTVQEHLEDYHLQSCQEAGALLQGQADMENDYQSKLNKLDNVLDEFIVDLVVTRGKAQAIERYEMHAGCCESVAEERVETAMKNVGTLGRPNAEGVYKYQRHIS